MRIPLPESYVPTQDDVLCGRGTGYSKNPGNLLFLALIRSNIKAYVEAPSRLDKSLVVASLVHTMKHTGARFVRRDKRTARYHELTHEQMHEKTGHAIRDILKSRYGTCNLSKKKRVYRKKRGQMASDDNENRTDTTQSIVLPPLPPLKDIDDDMDCFSLEPRPLFDELLRSSLLKIFPEEPLFDPAEDISPNPTPNKELCLCDGSCFDDILGGSCDEDLNKHQDDLLSYLERRNIVNAHHHQLQAYVACRKNDAIPDMATFEGENQQGLLPPSATPAAGRLSFDYDLFEIFSDEPELA